MKNLIGLFKDLQKNRKLIWELAKADFKKRFVGSYFGIVWMFVQPVVTVFIYFAIFQMGFKSVPPVPGAPYVLWLVPGIVPWFYFAEAMNTGTSCLQEYDYLVKKVVFNVQILPVIKLISCLIVHGIFVLIMIGMYFCFGRYQRLLGYSSFIIPLLYPYLCLVGHSLRHPSMYFLRIWHRLSALPCNLVCGLCRLCGIQQCFKIDLRGWIVC